MEEQTFLQQMPRFWPLVIPAIAIMAAAAKIIHNKIAERKYDKEQANMLSRISKNLEATNGH